jgi:FkbH-like protein
LLKKLIMGNKSLTYLQALKVIKNTANDKSESRSITCSVNIDPLIHFLRANMIQSYDADLLISTNEFGTLKQHLISNTHNDREILFLFPWDLIESLNWRTGITSLDAEYQNELNQNFQLIDKQSFQEIFYFSAPLPPIFLNANERESLTSELKMLASKLGSTIIDNGICLKNFISNGCPFDNLCLDETAKEILLALNISNNEAKKIIITDLDETFWKGVLGEDGLDGISAETDPSSHIHFVYQGYLKILKERGILLAICSKNDLDLVEEALRTKPFLVKHEDFVAIKASYERKSIMIRELSKELNLGLEHFVFIDDNPVEVNEILEYLPEVNTFLFPKDLNGLNKIFTELEVKVATSKITAEDKNRTKMYKNIVQTSHDLKNEIIDLSDYLQSLKMQVTIHDRSKDDNQRAIQLINKTNQFNLNGIRRDEKEVLEIIKNGGNLYSASLSDKNGEHGEVISILIDSTNTALSFVMSCRVFQRDLEYYFLRYLLKNVTPKLKIIFKSTERNKPASMFINKIFNNSNDDVYEVDLVKIKPWDSGLNKIFIDTI